VLVARTVVMTDVAIYLLDEDYGSWPVPVFAGPYDYLVRHPSVFSADLNDCVHVPAGGCGQSPSFSRMPLSLSLFLSYTLTHTHLRAHAYTEGNTIHARAASLAA
jgi:hypothetical protein